MIKYILSTFVFFISVYFIEQNDPVAAFVNYYSDTNNIYAEFETELPNQGNAKIKGSIYFTPKGNTKLSFNGNVILANNEVIKSYNERLNRLVISSADDYDFPLDLSNLFYSILRTEKIKLIKSLADGYLFSVKDVKFGNAQGAKITTDNGFNIKQIEVLFTNNSISLITFTKFVKNEKFGDDIFKLEIPANCKVIDIR